MKLSRTQRSVLDALRRGQILQTMTGLNPSAFICNPHRWVRLATVYRLKVESLIEDISNPETRWRGSTYRITESGRKSLEEEARK